jgi:serine protease Do
MERKGLIPLLVLVAVISLVFGILVSSSLDISPFIKAEKGISRGMDADPAYSDTMPAGPCVDFSKIASLVTPTVVSITSTELVERRFSNPLEELFPEYFSPPAQDDRQEKIPRAGAGSGFIIDKEGYILTNNHVIKDAVEIEVMLDSEKTFKADIVGSDSETDIALIKIDPGDEDLPVLPIGDSDKVKVGDWVMAVGNPAIHYLLDRTVTVGVISGKGRKRLVNQSFDDFLQTDAAINLGNSGGPLVNMRGEVIGINTLILANTEGLGFSIPINKAREIIPQLKDEGRVSRGWLGVSIGDITPAYKKAFGLDIDHGVLIQDILDGTPAEEAGLQHGDVIVAVDGIDIQSAEALIAFVSARRPGSEVEVTVIREGLRKSFDVTLAERGERLTDSQDSAFETEEEVYDRLGLTIEDIPSQWRRQHDFLGEDIEGVIVTDVKPLSPAYRSNMLPGDVIREINRHKIKNQDDFRREMKMALEAREILFYVQRGEVSSFIIVELE